MKQTSLNSQSKGDLEFLQSLPETEFTELVLIDLLADMKYSNIRYNHGPRELGKDVVFTRNDPIEGAVHCCAVVKMKQLSGSVAGSRSVREVFYQVEQSLKNPFVDPRNGNKTRISKAYVVTPFQIGAQAAESIGEALSSMGGRVSYIDGFLLLSLLKEHSPELLNGLRKASHRFVQTLLRRLSKRSSQSLSPKRAISLLEVYTAGTLSQTTMEAASLSSFAKPVEVVERLDIAESLHKSPFAVISADVGAGKTSMLQKLAVDALQLGEAGGVTSLTPVLVPLHRLPPQSLSSSHNLLNGIGQILSEDDFESFDINSPDLYWFLLDGFDEIATEHKAAERAIGSLRKEAKRISLTCRPSRSPRLPPPFEYYRLNPFSTKDMMAFLVKWFREDLEKAQLLHDHVLSHHVIRIFCRTPLMLTLYAILADDEGIGRLPLRRTGVYEAISDLLLGRWEDTKGVTSEFSRSIRGLVLELLALQLQVDGERRFPASRLHDAAAQVVRTVQPRLGQGNELGLQQEILYRTSLLTASGSGYYEFVHLSFQEFFAAKALFRKPDHNLEARTLFDDWWRGTWTFFFGQRRTLDDLSLTKRSRVRRSAALGGFLSEADYTTPEKRGEILQIIGREILYGPRLDAESLDHYVVYGLELLEQMKREVERSDFRGNTWNFVLVSLADGSVDALRTLLAISRLIIAQSELNDRISLLRLCVPHLADESAVDLFEDVSRAVRDELRGPLGGRNASKVWLELTDVHKRLSAVSGDRAASQQHLRRARSALMGPLSEIQPGSVEDLNELCEGLNDTNRIEDGLALLGLAAQFSADYRAFDHVIHVSRWIVSRVEVEGRMMNDVKMWLSIADVSRKLSSRAQVSVDISTQKKSRNRGKQRKNNRPRERRILHEKAQRSLFKVGKTVCPRWKAKMVFPSLAHWDLSPVEDEGGTEHSDGA